MNELRQNLVQSEAPFIVLTAKYIIEVQASVTYAFVLACTDSIRLSIPKGTRLFTENPINKNKMEYMQCEILSHKDEIDAIVETMVRNKFPEFSDEYNNLSCIGSIYIALSQLENFKIEDATDGDIFATFNIK